MGVHCQVEKTRTFLQGEWIGTSLYHRCLIYLFIFLVCVCVCVSCTSLGVHVQAHRADWTLIDSSDLIVHMAFWPQAKSKLAHSNTQTTHLFVRVSIRMPGDKTISPLSLSKNVLVLSLHCFLSFLKKDIQTFDYL